MQIYRAFISLSSFWPIIFMRCGQILAKRVVSNVEEFLDWVGSGLAVFL